jgi:hypothetical protein
MFFKSVIKSAFRFALLFDGTGFFLDIETPLKKRKTFDNHQMPFGAYTIRNRSRNVAYVPKLARGLRKFYISKKLQGNKVQAKL